MERELQAGLKSNDDLISRYFDYIGRTEAPIVFHRWSCLSILAAWLGRRYWFPFGHKNINCNMYVMLMGNAGSRKTTAIERATELIRQAGYTNISATKTTKEKFLLDLAGESDGDVLNNLVELNIFPDEKEDAEILISAEEFNIFVGNGNIEFLSLLGTLWDFKGQFENKVKNSKSTIINNPTITMIAGNTATSFSLAFPPEAIGQGIFSRLLIIYGERAGEKITFPDEIDPEANKELITYLQQIRLYVHGRATRTETATSLLDKIYKTYNGINDVRFDSYNNRRFTHLLKLCLLVSASRMSTEITEEDVLYANTILTYAEHFMPKALGEFGKARHSDVSHKLVSVLESADKPILTFKELWGHLHNDLDSPDALKELITNLVMADKIMQVKGGFISKSKSITDKNDMVDFGLLTQEERSKIL